MKITTIGLDLAKNVFQVHGIDERGKAVLRKQLKRKQVVSFFANLPVATGMTAYFTPTRPPPCRHPGEHRGPEITT